MPGSSMYVFFNPKKCGADLLNSDWSKFEMERLIGRVLVAVRGHHVKIPY